MKAALLQLEKEQLADQVIELKAESFALKERIAWFERQVFGSKHERFIPAAPGQIALDLGLESQSESGAEQEQFSYTRQKKKRKEKPFRQLLPANLRRVEETIEPEADLEGAVKIGEAVTEILEYKQAEFWVRRIIRPRYAWPGAEEKGVAIAELPSRPIDKGIAGASLLAQILLNKYVDHLPLYRQLRRFRRLGIKISMSTMCGWVSQCARLLLPLYMVLIEKMLESGYIQADETTMRVLDSLKKGASHLGYQWIYQNPEAGLVVFEYQKGRSRAGPTEMLKEYCGFLQNDGYKAYDIFESRTHYPNIQVLGCMAHARRYFFDAQKNDPKKAKEALLFFQRLYQIEKEAREQEMSVQQRHTHRQKNAMPVLAELKKWLDENLPETTPKSKIGEAIAYCLRRWQKLCNYTLDGRLEIDNNLAENSIRPIALGRKNYLFAGSHEAAQNAAIFYSFLASCKRNQVDPYEWLFDVLKRIKEHPVNQLDQLLPHKWKQLKS